jgi:pilus assembly protein CpaF
MNTLKELLNDSAVEDIVLSPAGLSYYREGTWCGPSASVDCEAASLQRLARGLAETAGLTLGLTQPSVDAFLALDGGRPFRAHVVVAPLALRGPEITLRRLPQAHRFRLEDFSDDEAQSETLRDAARRGLSLLICGKTGSGKTSLASAFLRHLPANTRTLVLEDSPELPLPNALSSKLIARPDRYGFRSGAAWELEHLVFESLRMRPDRLVLGECRGPEARAIAQALQTGHRGVVTTIHAGNARAALARFEALVRATPQGRAMALEGLWDLVVHVGETRPGVRRIREVLRVESSS